jgi:tetratricopeptide (TPR) repeat protein
MKNLMLVVGLSLLSAVTTLSQDKISGTDIDKFHKSADPSPNSGLRDEPTTKLEKRSQPKYSKPSKRQAILIDASSLASSMSNGEYNQLRESEAAFREAIKMNNKDPYAHWMLGIVLYRQGRWDEALDEVDLSFKQGWKEDEGLPDINRAYEWRNELAGDIVFNRGQAAFANRDWKTAAYWYLACLRIDPSNSSAFFDLGLCYENLGDYSAAIHAIQSAIALAPKEEAFQRELARLTGRDDRDPVVSDLQSTPTIRLFQRSVVLQRGDIIKYQSDRRLATGDHEKAFKDQQASASQSLVNYFNFCIVALRDNTEDAEGCKRYAETAPRRQQ